MNALRSLEGKWVERVWMGATPFSPPIAVRKDLISTVLNEAKVWNKIKQLNKISKVFSTGESKRKKLRVVQTLQGNSGFTIIAFMIH